MLKFLGSSEVYPIFASAASALGSTDPLRPCFSVLSSCTMLKSFVYKFQNDRNDDSSFRRHELSAMAVGYVLPKGLDSGGPVGYLIA